MKKYHTFRFGRKFRNDRCDCGSGKKYKYCCLPHRERRLRVQTHKVQGRP
jgi:hypothetical protein